MLLPLIFLFGSLQAFDGSAPFFDLCVPETTFVEVRQELAQLNTTVAFNKLSHKPDELQAELRSLNPPYPQWVCQGDHFLWMTSYKREIGSSTEMDKVNDPVNYAPFVGLKTAMKFLTTTELNGFCGCARVTPQFREKVNIATCMLEKWFNPFVTNENLYTHVATLMGVSLMASVRLDGPPLSVGSLKDSDLNEMWGIHRKDFCAPEAPLSLEVSWKETKEYPLIWMFIVGLPLFYMCVCLMLRGV